jgi:hypothetical protein
MRVIVAVIVTAVLALLLTGCNTDVCQHHGGLESAHYVGNAWYYHCNDGTTV